MSGGGFNLEDYVTVAERIAQFYAQFPDGSLQAEVIEISDHRVVVRAYAYRQPEDPRPGIAHSMLGIPGSTPYTKGSELENAETSAVGRAIALLGFGVKKSIASADELRGKGADVRADVGKTDDGGLVGKAEAGDQSTSDFNLRHTPDGPALGFRLRGEKGGILVEAAGPLATQLAALRDAVVGQRVTAWGRIHDVEVPGKDGKRGFRYQALAATRVRVPELGDLPAGDTSVDSMFTPEEQAGLDAAIGIVS